MITTSTPPLASSQNIDVIAWFKEPKLSSLLGKGKLVSEYTFKSDRPNKYIPLGSFEAHRTLSSPVLSDYRVNDVVLNKYRFPQMISEKNRTSALTDALLSARMIAQSPSLKNLQEVPSDTFFFDDEQITPGMGKVMVKNGDDRRYYVGNIDQMRDIFDTTKSAVNYILNKK